MVEMAGTAPACKEVLSSCIPVYDSFFDTLSTTWKMTKSRRVDFVYSYSLRNEEILKSETDNTVLPYQLLEKNVCSRPFGTHVPETRLHFRAIRQRKQMQECCSSWKKQQDERSGDVFASVVCHLITRLTAPRQHEWPYDSPYRILYHPHRNVHVQKQIEYIENLKKSKTSSDIIHKIYLS
jgi:hypothetical protein